MALLSHEVQCRVIWPPPPLGLRLGVRSMVAAPQDGHTKSPRSRSAEINAKASGARYSLIPLRPMWASPAMVNGGHSTRPRHFCNLPVRVDLG
jgi:hypothetical protein